MKEKTIQIAEYFGIKHQQAKAIEEYAEVIHAISKIQMEGISFDNREHLIEEMADGDLMKDQLMYFYEITEEEIEEIKKQKIERTIKRYEIDG